MASFPVATAPGPAFAPGSGAEITLSTHQFLAAWITSGGKTMPASWQARSPSAPYCVLELSPAGMPSRVLLTGMNRVTLGLVGAAPGFAVSLAGVATLLRR